MDRDEWLAERRKGLGSSDAAAVLGISPWATPYSVYLDKTGQLPDLPPSPAMEWGLRLEAAIAAAYAERTGEGFQYDGALQIYRDPYLPFMMATPDRITVSGKVVELKTASAYASDEWGEPGTDQIPDMYLVQISHQLAVMGLDLADVAVLIGGSDFRVYSVPRNDRLIKHLVEVEEAFWRRVQDRDPPEPSWSHPQTPAVLEAIYDVDSTMTCDLNGEAAQWADQYECCGRIASANAEERAVAKARLLYLMGHAWRGKLPDGRMVVRKRVLRKGYEVAATDYQTFRIQHPRQHEEKSL